MKGFATTVLLICTLGGAFPASAEGHATAGPADGAGAGEVLTVSDQEPGFVERYYPFKLPNDLEPEVEDSVVLIWVLSIFAGGVLAPLWAPPLLTGGGFPDGFLSDLVVSWLVHILAQCLPVIGFVLVPLNCLYFCPIATISIYDRSLKRARRGPSRAKGISHQAALAAPDGPAAMAF